MSEQHHIQGQQVSNANDEPRYKWQWYNYKADIFVNYDAASSEVIH